MLCSLTYFHSLLFRTFYYFHSFFITCFFFHRFFFSHRFSYSLFAQGISVSVYLPVYSHSLSLSLSASIFQSCLLRAFFSSSLFFLVASFLLFIFFISLCIKEGKRMKAKQGHKGNENSRDRKKCRNRSFLDMF